MVRPIVQHGKESVPPITSDELRSRVARIQEAMAAGGYGALVLYCDATRMSNVRYVVDFRPIDGYTDISQAVVLVPAVGQPELFVSQMNLLWGQEVSWFGARPFAELSDALLATRRSLPVKRVGVAGFSLMPGAMEAVIRGGLGLSSIKVEPAEELLAPIKAKKSSAEVALLRRAGSLVAAGIDAVREAVTNHGVTEREVAARATVAIIEAGGDGPAFDIQIQSGPHSSYNNIRSTDRVISEGDSILIEMGTRYRGYATDIARGATFGDVKPEQRKIIEVAAAALESGCRALRPGMTAGDLNKVIEKSLVDSGYLEFSAEARGYGTGHGIGTDIEEEEPWIRPGSNFVLEENMSLALKASIFVPGLAGVRVEDNLLVTGKGADVYTPYPRTLIW
jgi:Xaa-Pro aminopeptidase